MNAGEVRLIKHSLYNLVGEINNLKVKDAIERIKLASSGQITTIDGFNEAVQSIQRTLKAS